MSNFNKLVTAGIAYLETLAKRPKIDGNVQIAAHSGDAETMTFNLNLPSDLSTEEKVDKINEAFALIAARRQHTHELMEEIRKKAREEAEARQAIIAEAHGKPLSAVPDADEVRDPDRQGL